jgi:hypothetical protein
VKRKPLGPGRQSLERGSTFASRGEGLARSQTPSPHARPEDDDHAPPPPAKPKRLSVVRVSGQPKRKRSLGASTAQVAKRRRLGACIVTGATEGIDSAHLWDRSLGGCDSKHCVVPLRRDIHEAYDRHEFDLLPYLIAHGCVTELQHALAHTNGDLIGLLNRLTGDRYVPERSAAA